MARIVLIEDNHDLRDLLAHSLTSVGHAVWPTRDAAAGVAMCLQWEPDVLITDLVVPNHEALEKLAQPRRASTPAHIIVISGALDVAEPGRLAHRLGGRAMPKPFRTTHLVALVDELLASTETRVATEACASLSD